MSIRAKLLATVSALVVMGALGVAKADDKTQPAGTQGLNSVDKNQDARPGNRGLTNAETRTQDNIQDRADRKAADRDDKKKKRHDADDKTRKDKDKVDHAAKGDRPERPQHPERAGRS